MTRFAWSALLAGALVAITGCQKPAASIAEKPNEPDKIIAAEKIDGDKVAVAVGRALVKGITGGLARVPGPAEPPSL